MQEIAKELQGIRGERPVTADELQAAKDSADPDAARPAGRPRGAVAGSIGEIVRFGFDDRYFDGYAAKVRALDARRRGARPRGVVQPDKLVWVVVGDRAKIEAGSARAGPRRDQAIDADGNVK